MSAFEYKIPFDFFEMQKKTKMRSIIVSVLAELEKCMRGEASIESVHTLQSIILEVLALF